MIKIVLAGVLLLCAAGSYAGDQVLDRSSGWIYSYGVADRTQNSLVERAYSVFQRVRRASTLGPGEIPELVVVAVQNSPWAVAIRDGNIILSEGAVNFCYRDVAPQVGDSRLAFVLGHELAHQGNDDFWHAAAFELLQADGAQDQALADLQAELEQRTAADQGGDRELKADIDGLLAMSLAGFDPQAIIGEQTNFFAEWVAQSAARTGRVDAAHPSPEARAHFALSQLRPVANALGRFRFGLRLMQGGRYADALLLLTSFQEQYPGRAVFNNIALCYFHLALQELATCSAETALHYYYPLSLDAVTTAEKFSLRGGGQNCLDAPRVQSYLHKAFEFLRESIRVDENYVPARLNLAALMLLRDKAAEALALTNELVAQGHEQPEVLMLKALAVYEVGQTLGVDTSGEALAALDRLIDEIPDYAPAWYNRAALETERGRYAAADISLQGFLARMSSGRYAEYARQRLNLKNAPTGGETLAPPVAPPVSWDCDEQDIRSLWRSVAEDHISLALSTRLDIYTSEAVSVLMIARNMEMIVAEMPPLAASSLVERYGKPLQIYPCGEGETWVYQGFAVDIIADTAHRIVHYSPFAADRLNNEFDRN